MLLACPHAFVRMAMSNASDEKLVNKSLAKGTERQEMLKFRESPTKGAVLIPGTNIERRRKLSPHCKISE